MKFEITGNYFADVNAAIAAGIIPAGKNPKKAELIKIVDEWNAAQSTEAVGVEPIADLVIPEAEKSMIACGMPAVTADDLASTNFSEVGRQFADKQVAKAESRAAKSQPKAQPIVVEWDDESETLRTAFIATKDRLERSRIIYELSTKHGSSLTAEKLERTIAKIRAESRAYQYWLEDEKLQKAVESGMGWSKLIDNISNYKKALNNYLNPIKVSNDPV